MKKLVFMFVAISAMTFASCGSNGAKVKSASNDSTVVDSVDSVNADSLSADSVVK